MNKILSSNRNRPVPARVDLFSLHLNSIALTPHTFVAETDTPHHLSYRLRLDGVCSDHRPARVCCRSGPEGGAGLGRQQYAAGAGPDGRQAQGSHPGPAAPLATYVAALPPTPTSCCPARWAGRSWRPSLLHRVLSNPVIEPQESHACHSN